MTDIIPSPWGFQAKLTVLAWMCRPVVLKLDFSGPTSGTSVPLLKSVSVFFLQFLEIKFNGWKFFSQF